MLALPAYGRQRRQPALAQPQLPQYQSPAPMPVAQLTRGTPQQRPDQPQPMGAPWQPMAMAPGGGIIPQPQPSPLSSAAPMPIYRPPSAPSNPNPSGRDTSFTGFGNDMFQPGAVPGRESIAPVRSFGDGPGGVRSRGNPSRPGGSSPMSSAVGGMPIFGGGNATPQPTRSFSGVGNDMLRAGGMAGDSQGSGGLSWTPGAATQAPLPSMGGGSAPGARGPIFHNQSSGPALNREYTNSGGWWHDPTGTMNQDANRSMGGVMTPGTPGEPGSYNRNQNVAMTRNYLQNQAQNSLSSYGAGQPPSMPVAGGGGSNPWVDAYNQARQDNLNRYNELNEGYTRARQYLNDQLSGLGQQQRKDTDQTFDKNKASITQSMIDRGLVGSTVLDSMQTGNERERGSALARLEEALTRERINTEYPAFKDQADFMERRTDSYPDMNLLAQLMQGVGAGGGGAGVNMGDPFGGALTGGATRGMFPGTGYSYVSSGGGGSRGGNRGGSAAGFGRLPRFGGPGGRFTNPANGTFTDPGAFDSGILPALEGTTPEDFDIFGSGGGGGGGLNGFLGSAAGALGRGASSASTQLGSLLEMLLGRR